jgi:hypothetical protein
MYLESRGLAANTTNQQLAAVAPPRTRSRRRRLSESRIGCGITRVKGVKQPGFRGGNWLSAEPSSEVLKQSRDDGMRAKREHLTIALQILRILSLPQLTLSGLP